LARATKNNEKEGGPLEFFNDLFKLQAGTLDDDHHRESQLSCAVTRSSPTTACSEQLVLRKKAGVKRE
jgi:hypothetical protein